MTTSSSTTPNRVAQPLAPTATHAIPSSIEEKQQTEEERRDGRRMRRSSAFVRQYMRSRQLRSTSLVALIACFLALLSSPHMTYYGPAVVAAENNNNNNGYYQYNGNYYNNNGNNNGNNNNNGDDAVDDYYANNDDNNQNYNNDDNGDDDGANNDAYNTDDAQDDAYGNGNDDAAYGSSGDDQVSNEEAAAYANADDDVFHWNSNVGFDGVSVMPLSCINYNGGQMIKFQLFDSENSYQCHFSEIATFVVSIAHYMRAYFNYQALLYGEDFELPGDAGYLNCVMLQETLHSDMPLYAKIGCMDRETFTSTKLQLHVYQDNQCSQPYDDGETSRRHATKGFDINGYIFSTRVSFRPPFYTCDSCSPEEISDTFNKQNGNWYDDYYISQRNNNKNNNGDDDGNNDAYQQANDDVPRDDDYAYPNQDYNYNAFVDDDDYYKADDNVNNNQNNNYYNYNNNNGNNANNNNDDYNNGGGRARNRWLKSAGETIGALTAAAPGQLDSYYNEFWNAYYDMQKQRSLYENNYDAGDWNMCQRIYKYGVWCDEECRALDFFRTDQWSASDIFLLSIMCTFVTAMMLLVVAKRLKAQQKAKIYGEELPMPGLPPLAMALIFFVIMAVIIALSKLKFVNETLVFAVVTCILLFIYVLRLTLFESPRPVLLAAPSYFERYDERFDTD